MANQLKMAMIEAILRLHQRGWSNRRIARELGIDRGTVARQLRAGPPRANAAIPLTGTTPALSDPNAAISLIGAGSSGAVPAPEPGGSECAGADPLAAIPDGRGRRSDCEPWRALIVAKVELGLSAQRIYQDLVSTHGFAASYHSVQRFVRRLGASRPLPFRRLECAPGEEAQVDFGSGIPITPADGKRRQTHVFRIVLSHSRKG